MTRTQAQEFLDWVETGRTMIEQLREEAAKRAADGRGAPEEESPQMKALVASVSLVAPAAEIVQVLFFGLSGEALGMRKDEQGRMQEIHRVLGRNRPVLQS